MTRKRSLSSQNILLYLLQPRSFFRRGIQIVMKTTTKFTMARVLGVGALMGVVAIAVPVQEASAQGDTNFTFKQRRSNDRSESAACSNTATITFGGPIEQNVRQVA